jgi:glycosyltransferase involved in cell wall biosynthesis
VISGLTSVVIPTYNRADLLIRAVESVRAQTRAEHEVVVVDDGSTDGTEEAVRSRFGGDPKVRYFRQKNAGVAAARNRGLREGVGEFFAFLDSDDEWFPWKLELQIGVLREHPEVGMVWSDMRAVDAGGAVLFPKYLRRMYQAYRFFPEPTDLFSRELALPALARPADDSLAGAKVYAGDIFGPMVLGSLVHTSTVVLRRSRQEKTGFFDENYRTGEDFKFHLHTCRAGEVAFVDAATALYRVGAEDALSSAKNLLPVAKNYLETLETTLREDGAAVQLPEKLLRRCRAEAYAWVGNEYLAEGDRKKGREHLLKSLSIKPEARTAALLVKSFVPEALLAAYRARRKAGSA